MHMMSLKRDLRDKRKRPACAERWRQETEGRRFHSTPIFPSWKYLLLLRTCTYSTKILDFKRETKGIKQVLTPPCAVLAPPFTTPP